MRRLPAKRHLVPFDAERPEHHAERQVHRLQDGALLDVQLEIRSRALELGPRFQRRVQVDSVLAQGVRKRDPRRVLA